MTKIYCKDKEGNLRCVQASTDASISGKGQQYLRRLLKDVDIIPEEKGFVAVVVDGGRKKKSLTSSRKMRVSTYFKTL